MDRNEELANNFVLDGWLSIDCDGRIWRNIKSVGGMAQNLIRLNPPTRAENTMPNGYLQLQFYIGGKLYTCQAHRLVWFHFHGRIPDKMIVHHKNENKQDNRIENLLLMTYSQHNRHHPRTPWNKNLSTELLSKRNIMRTTTVTVKKTRDTIAIWHAKTVDTRHKNYLKRCQNTYNMRYGEKRKTKDIAQILDVSVRTVQQHIQDYRMEVM